MTERGLVEPECERAGRKVAKDVPNCGMRDTVMSSEREKIERGSQLLTSGPQT